MIDGRAPGRTYEGLGAVSAGASSRLLIDYPEPSRSQILDYLFKPNYGASLQNLKVEIGCDNNSTDGSEPSHMHVRGEENYNRGYEWWLKEACARNPHMVLGALPWCAPGWIGNGKFFSQDMADYVANFVEGAKKAHGLDIAYVGTWNELGYDAGYVKRLKTTLLARGLNTKIVCCDNSPLENQWKVIDDLSNDLKLAQALDVVGVHYPQPKAGDPTIRRAIETGKPIWSSEDEPQSLASAIPKKRDWDSGDREFAKIYNRNYIESRMTNTQVWPLIKSYYDPLDYPNS